MQTENQAWPAELSAEGMAMLRFVAEQVTVPIDQLARALRIPLERTDSLATSLEEASYVRSEKFLAGEHRWLWLTRSGSEMSGTGLPHRGRRPDLRLLNHWRAITDVRLYLEEHEPRGRWFSETMLSGARRRHRRLPDGVFEVGGERHAIEVELSSKNLPRYQHLWTLNSRPYDAVVYFCEPRLARRLQKLKEAGEWPKVVVRTVPTGTFKRRAQRSDKRREPNRLELEAMKVIAEQGVVRLDQLGGFLGMGQKQVDRLVEDLIEGRFATRRTFFPGQPDGIYLTWLGARLAPTGLKWWVPKVGAVKDRYAFNDLRLHFASSAPEAQWLSRRVLVKLHGRQPQLPGAELVLAGRRCAINYRTFSTAAPGLVTRTGLQDARYDAVMFFCASISAFRCMERLRQENGWTKVVTLEMPRTSKSFTERSVAERLVESTFGY